MSEHTPGPWQIVNNRPLEIFDENGTPIARMRVVDGEEANAKLIARAPEMLAELERVKKDFDEWLNCVNVPHSWVKRSRKSVRAAIAKATQ